MRILGNLLWLVLAGFWLFLGYLLAGVIMCIFVITVPFGLQAFKLARYSLWPFGKMVVRRPGADAALGCLGNGLWLIFGGLGMALAHLITGALLCITIIGIPLGIVNFRMAGLALSPFGKMVVNRNAVQPDAAFVVAAPQLSR